MIRQEIKNISENIEIKDKESFEGDLGINYEQLDFEKIQAAIDKKYGKNAESLAFNNILDKARHLKRYAHGEVIGSHEIKNTTLMLEGTDPENIAAFQKLADIILDKTTPSKAQPSTHILNVKTYVNRRLDIKFDTLENAKALRRAIELL